MKIVKQNQIVGFLTLTFFFTWILWIPATAAKLGGGTPVFGPDSPLGQVGRWSPGIAAVLLTAILAGKQGTQKLLQPLGIWRVHIGWYLIAIFLQPVLLSVARWIDDLLGNSSPFVSPLASVRYPLAFVIPVMLISAFPGSLAEELGWRGFALPALQKKLNAVFASLVIALFWGAWHVPTWLYSGQTAVMEIAWAILNFIPVAILFTWIYNNTNGSLLLVTLLHVSQQLTFAIWGLPSRMGDLLMWLVALILVITYGAELRRTQSEMRPAYR